jgi:hypothetical protein
MEHCARHVLLAIAGHQHGMQLLTVLLALCI